MLDILFENRNKDYGAYALRSSYNNTIKSSLLITTFICACFCGYILLHHSKENLIISQVITIPDSDPIQIPSEKPKPPEAAKPLPRNNSRQITNSTPVIVKDNEPTTQPTVDDLLSSKIGDIKMNGDLVGDAHIAAPSNGNGNSISNNTTSTKVDDETKIFERAEVMPEFPGGIDALRKFIIKNIHQPDDLEAGQKIVVMASFVVSKTGKIENLKIANSGRTDLDKEVLRVINKMPLWKPGMQNGSAVSVYFNLPVTFMPAAE